MPICIRCYSSEIEKINKQLVKCKKCGKMWDPNVPRSRDEAAILKAKGG